MQEHQTEMDISRVEREQKFHNQRFADDSTRKCVGSTIFYNF